MVHENSLLYEETSAKSGFNVTESFEKIVNGKFIKTLKNFKIKNLIELLYELSLNLNI